MAQKTFVEFVGESDKIFFDGVFASCEIGDKFKKEIKSGTINENNLVPKKIGLVTLYVFEENYRKRKAHLTYIYSLEGEVNYFYNKISKQAAEGLKQGFAGSGYELVMPQDFLSSESKKKAFSVAMENINDLSDPFLETVKAYNLSPAADPHQFVYTYVEDGTNGFVADELSTLAKELGLDGLLTVQLSTLYQTQTISFSGLSYVLHGINPIAPEGEQGLVISNYALYPDYPYPFVSVRNGKTSSERYGGYRKLLERATKDYLKFNKGELEDLF